MTITDEELERRREYICSSDVGAILGADPWRNAHDVFMEKRHGVHQDSNEAIDMGNWLERPLVDWAAYEIRQLHRGWKEYTLEYGGEETHGKLMCHPDATLHLRYEHGEPFSYLIEAKSTSSNEGWGEPMTDAVPLRVLAQVQVQMMLTGITVTYIPVLLPRYGRLSREMFLVEADRKLQRRFFERCEKFWFNHVACDVPPEVPPSLVTLKHLMREELESPMPVRHELVETYNSLLKEKAAAARASDEAKARLLAALGNNTHGITEEGHEITYKEQARKEVTIPATTFRVLRVKKPKARTTKE